MDYATMKVRRKKSRVGVCWSNILHTFVIARFIIERYHVLVKQATQSLMMTRIRGGWRARVGELDREQERVKELGPVICILFGVCGGT
jgi:hypothetical protein